MNTANTAQCQESITIKEPPREVNVSFQHKSTTQRQVFIDWIESYHFNVVLPLIVINHSNLHNTYKAA